ncbi:MAG: DUF2141 domain-containing protein [Ginsengibacter sp.]|jgi:uncharacterized protein (DUF2141 family)
MKLFLSQSTLLIAGTFILLTFSSFQTNRQKLFSLTVETNNLRNNEGTVVFALYNREDAFPDEHYKKYFKKLIGKIENHSARVTFKDLPAGKYAIDILHDEDNDGKIKMGFLLPKEGIGFSNYQSIGIGNRPNFKKASFILQDDLKINVKAIYF